MLWNEWKREAKSTGAWHKRLHKSRIDRGDTVATERDFSGGFRAALADEL